MHAAASFVASTAQRQRPHRHKNRAMRRRTATTSRRASSIGSRNRKTATALSCHSWLSVEGLFPQNTAKAPTTAAKRLNKAAARTSMACYQPLAASATASASASIAAAVAAPLTPSISVSAVAGRRWHHSRSTGRKGRSSSSIGSNSRSSAG